MMYSLLEPLFYGGLALLFFALVLRAIFQIAVQFVDWLGGNVK